MVAARWGSVKLDFERIHPTTIIPDDAEIWYAHRTITGNSSWFNHAAYLDVLNPAAIKEFIHHTHEVYHRQFQEYFGNAVIGFFTDEPQTAYSGRVRLAKSNPELILPWTDDFAVSYQQQWHEDLLDFIPLLAFDRGDTPAPQRWRYRDYVAERFCGVSGGLGAWCQSHGVISTGHLMAEHNLSSQCEWVGECMRHYRHFDLPGIDVLWDSLNSPPPNRRKASPAKMAVPG